MERINGIVNGIEEAARQQGEPVRFDPAGNRRELDGLSAHELAELDTAATFVSVEIQRADALALLDGMIHLRRILTQFGQAHQLPEGFARVQTALRTAIDEGGPLPLLVPEVLGAE